MIMNFINAKVKSPTVTLLRIVSSQTSEPANLWSRHLSRD